MSATPSVIKKSDGDLGMVNVVDLLLDNSYPTGGYALTGKPLGLRVGQIDQVHAAPASGFVFEWDPANAKLLAFYADNDAGADGALIEVANAVDLSSVTSRAAVHGR